MTTRSITHPDLLAGLSAVAWAILAVDPGDGPMVPALAALCSAMVAGPFGLVALGRWYNAVRQPKVSDL